MTQFQVHELPFEDFCKEIWGFEGIFLNLCLESMSGHNGSTPPRWFSNVVLKRTGKLLVPGESKKV